MSAHRVTCQPLTLWISLKSFACCNENFKRIDSSPIFPVETIRSSIGWRGDECPIAWRIALCLTECFNTCAVKREDDSWMGVTFYSWLCGRDNSKILRAAFDLALKSFLACCGRRFHGQFDRCFVEHSFRISIWRIRANECDAKSSWTFKSEWTASNPRRRFENSKWHDHRDWSSCRDAILRFDFDRKICCRNICRVDDSNSNPRIQ